MSIPVNDTRALLLADLARIREIRSRYRLNGVQAMYNPPLPLDDDGEVDQIAVDRECDFPPV